jgi:hypothetical protein
VAVLGILLTALAMAPAAAEPAPAVGHAAGEQMEFSIHHRGLFLGRARIQVGRPEGRILPVFLEARTSGVASVFDFRQQLASYLDLDTGLPRSSSLASKEGDYRHFDTADFDRQSNVARVRIRGKHDNTYDVPVPPGTLDFVALVFRLRALPLDDGRRHAFHVLARRDVALVVCEVVGREQVSTRAGSFPAVKVRVPTSFRGEFEEKNPTFVWFSDDARRIVLRISTGFAIGHATARLESYTPGDRDARTAEGR